jgi:hypothetical protein
LSASALEPLKCNEVNIGNYCCCNRSNGHEPRNAAYESSARSDAEPTKSHGRRHQCKFDGLPVVVVVVRLYVPSVISVFDGFAVYVHHWVTRAIGLGLYFVPVDERIANPLVTELSPLKFLVISRDALTNLVEQ